MLTKRKLRQLILEVITASEKGVTDFPPEERVKHVTPTGSALRPNVTPSVRKMIMHDPSGEYAEAGYTLTDDLYMHEPGTTKAAIADELYSLTHPDVAGVNLLVDIDYGVFRGQGEFPDFVNFSKKFRIPGDLVREFISAHKLYLTDISGDPYSIASTQLKMIGDRIYKEAEDYGTEMAERTSGLKKNDIYAIDVEPFSDSQSGSNEFDAAWKDYHDTLWDGNY